MSRHGLRGKISNGQRTARHRSFITGDKWYISRKGNKENKGHKRRVDESLKGMQGGFDPCCIHVVSLIINHLDKKGVMSSSAVKRAKGSKQCK